MKCYRFTPFFLCASLLLMSLTAGNRASLKAMPASDGSLSAPWSQKPDSIAPADDMVEILLPTVRVTGSPHKPLSRSEQYLYWRRVRDVKKVLPIAEELTSMIIETYDYLDTFSSERERKEHLKRIERELIQEYKPKMKNLTLTQGLLLIKLMDRQSGSTGYDIVKSIYGNFSAFWYNTIAKVYGGDLKARYDPAHVEDDAVTERIIYLYRHGLI